MTSSNSRQHHHPPRRQLDTSLERQARLAAANAVASCFPSPLRRQRSSSLNTNAEQTRWLLLMPTVEVMYLFSFSLALCADYRSIETCFLLLTVSIDTRR